MVVEVLLEMHRHRNDPHAAVHEKVMSVLDRKKYNLRALSPKTVGRVLHIYTFGTVNVLN